MRGEPQSPWIIALPALIIGPVTYLVSVSMLILRQRGQRQVGMPIGQRGKQVMCA